MTWNESNHQSDVPDEVFARFLEVLAKAEMPADVISRLRQTLLVDHKFSDTALKTAVFGEESQS